MGSGNMSSEIPCALARSRRVDSASTDHASSAFLDGRLPQMLLTPNAARTRRMSSASPCCVPTFILAFGEAFGAVGAGLAGVLVTCDATTASARAPTDMPAPANRTNSRRFMESPAVAGLGYYNQRTHGSATQSLQTRDQGRAAPGRALVLSREPHLRRGAGRGRLRLAAPRLRAFAK